MPNNMVSAPSKGNSFSNPSNGDAPTGGAIKGFGGGKIDSSTLAASAGKSGVALGASIQGFSGTGTLTAKV